MRYSAYVVSAVHTGTSEPKCGPHSDASIVRISIKTEVLTVGVCKDVSVQNEIALHQTLSAWRLS